MTFAKCTELVDWKVWMAAEEGIWMNQAGSQQRDFSLCCDCSVQPNHQRAQPVKHQNYKS